MKHACAVLAAIALGLFGAKAQANPADCGGNAETFADVVHSRPGQRQRGPVMVRPETLCADIIEANPRRSDPLNVYLNDPARSRQDSGQARRNGEQPRSKPGVRRLD